MHKKDEELIKPEDCLHEQFQCIANVFRLKEDYLAEKVTGYTADIKIHCMQCGQAFEFLGVPGGTNPAFPTVNADNTELRAPIRPSKEPIQKKEGIIYN